MIKSSWAEVEELHSNMDCVSCQRAAHLVVCWVFHHDPPGHVQGRIPKAVLEGCSPVRAGSLSKDKKSRGPLGGIHMGPSTWEPPAFLCP